MIKTIKSDGITWIDIEQPSSRDLQFLKDNFSFHPLVLEELVPPAQRTKVENYGEYLFMIVHVPFLNRKERKVESLELDFLITKTHLITSRYHSILPLKALFDQCMLYEEARREFMGTGTSMLFYEIMERVLASIFPKLEFFESGIDEIEEEIFKGKEREMVFEVSILKRAVIDFRRVMEPQKLFLDSLMKEGVSFFEKKFEPYLFDLAGSYSKIWDHLENQKETLEALENTNIALASTKTNEVIRILTIIFTITLPISLLANIYGMNTSLPLTDGPVKRDFITIAIAMLLGAVLTIWYFKKKRWL